MDTDDLLKALFPKRWIPDHEPTYSNEEVEVETIGELLLPTRATKIGEYKLGEYPERIYTFKDKTHFQIIELHFKKGEIIMVVYSFGGIMRDEGHK